MNDRSAFEFIDVHAHLNFSAFDADRDATIKRALDVGVYMINVGTQKDTSKAAVELAEKYEEGVYAIIGLHPIHTGKSYHDLKELGEGGKEFTSRGEVFDSSIYRSMAKHPKVVGIGECGLDYYRMGHEAWNIEHKIQEEAFRKHIELAIETGKPLMFHVRNGGGRSAYRDVLAILKSYPSEKLRGVFHCFVGSWEEAKEILDCGFNLSFTGIITFAMDYDEAVKNVPLDRLMSDTDCPYLAPVPYRGKRNEPSYVPEIVKRIAQIRGQDLDVVKKQLFHNAVRFFGLKIDN